MHYVLLITFANNEDLFQDCQHPLIKATSPSRLPLRYPANPRDSFSSEYYGIVLYSLIYSQILTVVIPTHWSLPPRPKPLKKPLDKRERAQHQAAHSGRSMGI